MKKYRFLFLTLLFGIFLIPKDVFAANLPTGITFYDKDYNVVGQCSNCTELYNVKNGEFVPYENVGKVRVTFEDIPLFSRLKYTLDTKLLINYTTAPPVTYVGLCFGSNGCLDMSGYTWQVTERLYDTPLPGATAFTYQFKHSWTQPVNTDEFFIETYFDTTKNVFLGASLSSNLLNTGDSDGDIIAGVGQNIINNDNKNQQQTNERLDGIKDFLESDEEPSSDISSLGNVQGLLPPGPVDSLLNIPFKFLSIIVSSLGELCVPLSFNWVFNNTLTLPCFTDSFYDNVPSYLMLFINLIPSGFILINYLKHLYKKVDRAVSLETNADDEWGVL